jgi:dihydrolipoamide dehydrogenase
VESREQLGGVCLTEGCIPSKTLIHAVGLARNADEATRMGLVHDGISFDVEKLRRHVQKTVKVLSSGVSSLVENREIERITGHARFQDKNTMYVDGANTIVHFNQAIIATGSEINSLPDGIIKNASDGEGDNDGIWTSAHALSLPEIPESLLVIGGGYIGLEIGQAYAGLGSRVTLVEFNEALLSGADKDLVRVVVKHCERDFEAVHTGSRVTAIEPAGDGFRVTMEKTEQSFAQEFSRVLAATGRHPNTRDLGLELAGLETDSNGLIPTDDVCRTAVPHIFAIGDVAKGPALAHKASREGKVAVEVICGKSSAFDNVAVPAVLFTHPEIAWTGLTEADAKENDIAFKVGKFPLTALGRARSTGKTDGFVKVLAEPESDVILGVGIVGEHASELVAEATLAIEMGATLEDLIVTIHPHPTFSESLMEAAEMAASGSVHMMRQG